MNKRDSLLIEFDKVIGVAVKFEPQIREAIPTDFSAKDIPSVKEINRTHKSVKKQEKSY